MMATLEKAKEKRINWCYIRDAGLTQVWFKANFRLLVGQ